jgi:hypothetical protein
VAEGGGLLNRYRLVKAYRGFESLRLRQSQYGNCERAVRIDLTVKPELRAGAHVTSIWSSITLQNHPRIFEATRTQIIPADHHVEIADVTPHHSRARI